MAPSLVQSTVASGNGAFALSPSNNVTAGNTIIFFSFQNTTGAPTVSISGTATLSTGSTAISTDQSTGTQTHKRSMMHRYCVIATGGSLTLTFSGAGTMMTVGIEEWSGLTTTPFDNGVSANGTTANPSPATLTPVAGGELCVGVCCFLTGISITANSPFVMDSTGSIPNSTDGNFLGQTTVQEYELSGPSTAFGPSWTAAAGDWLTSYGFFKPAAASSNPFPAAYNYLTNQQQNAVYRM